jgi:hypothetical protein
MHQNNSVFHLGDLALFYRTPGSSDRRQRKKKNQNSNVTVGKLLFNPDVANAAGVGASLGATADAFANSPLQSLEKRVGGLPTKGALGVLRNHKTAAILGGSTALGLGSGIVSRYRKLKAEQRKRRLSLIPR